MPELPEVQTTVEGLKTVAKGLTILDVWTDYNSPFHSQNNNIKNPLFFKKFKKLVVGQKIITVERRAKNILIHLANKHTVLIHMKMTGHILSGHYNFNESKKEWLAIDKGPLQDPFNRFIHFVITLSNKKQLALSDMRKFAKVTVIPTAELENSKDLATIGPEPLEKDFVLKDFIERLGTKPSGKIKTVLMDQEVIAGIGNIYSDEILWQAGVHPETRVNTITKELHKRLFEAMREILQRSLTLGGDSMSDYRNIKGEKGGFHPYHNAYRQHGKPCMKKGCSGVIIRRVIGSRSSHFCNTHQK